VCIWHNKVVQRVITGTEIFIHKGKESTTKNEDIKKDVFLPARKRKARWLQGG
jgi:hypothetical protein